MYFSFTILIIIIPLVTNQRKFPNFPNSDSSDYGNIVFLDYDFNPNGFNWNEINRDDVPPTTTRPSTTTFVVPGMATRRSRCEDRCQITPQYNPVCGSNRLTYSNHARLLCAQRCGIKVNLVHYGVCVSSLTL